MTKFTKAAMAVTFLVLTLAVLTSTGKSQPDKKGDNPALSVASFDRKGTMTLPEDLDQWVFLGSSLGMGYSQVDFNPDTPGNFQIVTMEPTAYQAFLETGHFAEGTMIALTFYKANREVSISQSGFTMGEPQLVEIHYKDANRFPQGFNFYMFPTGVTEAKPQALPNDCVTCHVRDGAYEGVFAQFYPAIRDKIPQDALQKALAKSHASIEE